MCYNAIFVGFFTYVITNFIILFGNKWSFSNTCRICFYNCTSVLNNNANNEAKESTYNIGGICGSIDIKAKLQLNNIVSAGEISLYEGEYTNDTKRNITNLLNCGGVIGYINGDSKGEVTLNTIVSLTTIMNTLSNNIAGTSHINAIIGNGKVNATDVCYSHVATLCTDENIVNFKNLNFDG